MLTFEGTPIQGATAIVEKLTVNLFLTRLWASWLTLRRFISSEPSIHFGPAQGHHLRRPAFVSVRCQPYGQGDRVVGCKWITLHLLALLSFQYTAPQVDDSPNPLQFSQVFQLIPENGSYYV